MRDFADQKGKGRRWKGPEGIYIGDECDDRGTTLVFLMSMQTHEAIRVPFPNGEEQQQEGLIVEKVMGLFESLRSTDPPSGPSTCTNIPVNSGVDLCVSEKNYAGRAMAPPRPYQHLMSPVGMSANRK
ncbi:hypothetical protein GH714_036603 [Hevea brasiliensis]|uniref:Uncharacterized protein n=1 Tax=Hevea brasiliensis TaxID=3981 RepID=A0A6A6LQV9_HEVBR|nr:hypothetical protein GH714_036603 [Hevea brasiliensis]